MKKKNVFAFKILNFLKEKKLKQKKKRVIIMYIYQYTFNSLKVALSYK